MIVPEDLSLEELIGAMKVNAATELVNGNTDNYAEICGRLYMAEVIKRELDKKEDK